VLHIVAPARSETDAVLHAKTIVNRTFADPSETAPVNFKVLEDPSPVDAVIRESQNFDLVVVGVEEQWGMESHLFGFRPERIARQTPGSLLIVRKYAGPHGFPTAAGEVKGEPTVAAGA
jgi:nucleotide-binding universal stress UspA family protein